MADMDWPVTEEYDMLRKHLITEHGVLDAGELGDVLAVAEHYSQHFSPDGGQTPPKGIWSHPHHELDYNPEIDKYFYSHAQET